MQVTKLFVDSLMVLNKRIDDEIEWDRKSNHENCSEFRVAVKVPNAPEVKLVLVGSINRVVGCFSFTLVYNSVSRIKALDVGGREHRNKCRNHTIERVGRKHKHTWNDCCDDHWAYVPDDITDSAPFEQVFSEFLKECNIDFNGSLPPLPSSAMELMLDELLDGA